MKSYYYADANNQPVGPHSLEQLAEAASNGIIGGIYLPFPEMNLNPLIKLHGYTLPIFRSTD